MTDKKIDFTNLTQDFEPLTREEIEELADPNDELQMRLVADWLRSKWVDETALRVDEFFHDDLKIKNIDSGYCKISIPQLNQLKELMFGLQIALSCWDSFGKTCDTSWLD